MTKSRGIQMATESSPARRFQASKAPTVACPSWHSSVSDGACSSTGGVEQVRPSACSPRISGFESVSLASAEASPGGADSESPLALVRPAPAADTTGAVITVDAFGNARKRLQFGGRHAALPRVTTWWLDSEPAAHTATLRRRAPPRQKEASGAGDGHTAILGAPSQPSAGEDAPGALRVWGGTWQAAAAALSAALFGERAEDDLRAPPPQPLAPPPLLHLRVLVLVHCGVTVAAVLALPVLPVLRTLDLSDNRGLRGLARQAGGEELPFSSSSADGGDDDVGDYEAYWLAFAPRLERLRLCGCGLTASPPLLGGGTSLVAVDLSGVSS